MKRTELVALSRAAVRRAASNQIGVIGPTKKQLEKLAEHKKKKDTVKQPQSVRGRRAAS
jgi:ethanolamine ammonia-lyase small subunit